MRYRCRISGSQWEKIYEYLCGFSEIYVRNKEKCRQFVEAVQWLSVASFAQRIWRLEYGISQICRLGEKRHLVQDAVSFSQGCR